MKSIVHKRDEQRALLEDMGDGIDALKKRLERLWLLYHEEFGGDDEYIRDGGFTDAGRKRLRQLFGEGKRNMEIATFFGVTDSAIAYHRRRWEQLEGSRSIR